MEKGKLVLVVDASEVVGVNGPNESSSKVEEVD